jgi:hypothetical protein
MKLVRRLLNPITGYLLTLLGFVSLGLLVAALALQSGWAVVLGVSLLASFGLAVVCFRNGSATLAKAREAGMIGDNASIWAQPLRQEQVDGYHVNYRGGRPQPRRDMLEALPAIPSERQQRQPTPMPTRLSA